MTYMVSSYYRGAINIGDMRSFEDVNDAWAYWDTIYGRPSWKRIYELSSKAAPRLLKVSERPTQPAQQVKDDIDP